MRSYLSILINVGQHNAAIGKMGYPMLVELVQVLWMESGNTAEPVSGVLIEWVDFVAGSVSMYFLLESCT